MQTLLHSRLLARVVFILAVSCVASGAQAAEFAVAKRAPAAVDPQAQAEAGQLVREALQAEATGKPDVRADMLKKAMDRAPDFAPAHWHAGEVKRGDRWLSADDAAKQAAADEKVKQYQKLRDQSQLTYDDQMALARWCLKQGLKDQERGHLTLALILDPGSRDAMSRLGLTVYRGLLMPPDQIADFEARNKRWKWEVAEWKGLLVKLRQEAESSKPDDALTRIRAIRDPAAIPALETIFARSKPAAGHAAIDALAHMPQQAAVESLVRFAVLSGDESVRAAAASSLRSRDVHAYMPLLLAGMNTPIQGELDTYCDSSGRPAYRLTLFREGMFENFALSQTEVAPAAAPETRKVGDTTFRTIRTDRPVPMPNPNALMARAAASNEQTRDLNSRIAAVLAAATSIEPSDSAASKPSDSAMKWWDWWYDFNGYYTPDQVPTTTDTRGNYPTYGYRVVSRDRPPQPPPSMSPRRCECFVTGTTVWTATGPARIEQVQPGELVLSQNPETGELAYKPVIGTTMRPPSQLIETHVGGQVIRSTRGHPFWVAGIGWQMANELKAGQWLHTARGPMKIESAEEAYEDMCYNIVVADFHSYFVSDAQVLVHDNELRGPNTATVPGLLKL